MTKKAPIAFTAAILLGTTPALANDASDRSLEVDRAAKIASSKPNADYSIAQAQSEGSSHGSKGGMKPSMSHEEMMKKSAEGGAASGHVMAHGVVNAVNESDRTVNLSHEPISALGWPSMTMDMKVSDDVDLAKVPVGKPVDITLSKDGDGIYMVKTITTQ